MKKILALGLLMMSSLVMAGGDKGNGGGVHVCSDGSVEMYDLFEGRVRYGYKPVSNLNTTKEYLDRALAKIHNVDPGFEWKVREQLAYLESHIRLSDEVVLTPVGDANILLIGKGCNYQQLANWDEVTGNVFVEQKLFEKMTPRNVAALYIHEAIYKVLRELKVSKTSDLARQIVADVFDQSLEMKSPEKILSYGEYSYFSNLKLVKEAKPFSSEVNLVHGTSYYRNSLNIQIKQHFGDMSFYSLSPEERSSFKIVFTVYSEDARDKLEALKADKEIEYKKCEKKIFGKNKCYWDVDGKFNYLIQNLEILVNYLKEIDLGVQDSLHRTKSFYFTVPRGYPVDLKVQVFFKGEVIAEAMEKGLEYITINYDFSMTENERAVR